MADLTDLNTVISLWLALYKEASDFFFFFFYIHFLVSEECTDLGEFCFMTNLTYNLQTAELLKPFPCLEHGTEANFLLSFHSKIEDAFYENKLRLNGQKLIKKSKTVSEV